jgi:16S rRNA G966 N2-methylase RsmD
MMEEQMRMHVILLDPPYANKPQAFIGRTYHASVNNRLEARNQF